MPSPAHPLQTPSPSALDQLLSTYLHLLNRYTELQAELAQHFSQGHLSLARARFSGSPSAVYFGISPASFEGKARVARVRCNVVPAAQLRSTLNPSVGDAAFHRSSKGAGQGVANSHYSSEIVETLGIEVHVLPPPQVKVAVKENGDFAGVAVEENSKVEQRGKLDAADPLRLFGLFPPVTLRDAQAAFEKGLCRPVAELVGVVGEMASLEARIREERARRENGELG